MTKCSPTRWFIHSSLSSRLQQVFFRFETIGLFLISYTELMVSGVASYLGKMYDTAFLEGNEPVLARLLRDASKYGDEGMA